MGAFSEVRMNALFFCSPPALFLSTAAKFLPLFPASTSSSSDLAKREIVVYGKVRFFSPQKDYASSRNNRDLATKHTKDIS